MRDRHIDFSVHEVEYTSSKLAETTYTKLFGISICIRLQSVLVCNISGQCLVEFGGLNHHFTTPLSRLFFFSEPASYECRVCAANS